MVKLTERVDGTTYLVHRVAAERCHISVLVSRWVELSAYLTCQTTHPYPSPLLFPLIQVMLLIRVVVEFCQSVLTLSLAQAARSVVDSNV